MGVRQGCVLSPMLFAIFLNDLHDSLSGGVKISDCNIRVLMYADDIVVVADSPDKLQSMINDLDCYCRIWNLTINLNKSKIMVFSSGGRRARNEHWFLRGQEVEIVKSYKYLGMELTSKLSVHTSLKERILSAKASINVVWKSFLAQPNVSISQKVKLFKAVSRAILCYGAQVWGFQRFEEIEKVQRYFLKKILGLPHNTPNYMLSLETGMENMFFHTLSLHFDYIIRVMMQPESRLTAFLAREVIRKGIFWVAGWTDFFGKTGVSLDMRTFDRDTWLRATASIISKLKDLEVEGNRILGRASTHDEYCRLTFDGPKSYFNDNMKSNLISQIFKIRGGLFYLNARSEQLDVRKKCSLCNTGDIEDTGHFLAVCPILNEIRICYFGKNMIDKDELLCILNGSNWESLCGFLQKALAYRLYLIREFNFT